MFVGLSTAYITCFSVYKHIFIISDLIHSVSIKFYGQKLSTPLNTYMPNISPISMYIIDTNMHLIVTAVYLQIFMLIDTLSLSYLDLSMLWSSYCRWTPIIL